ncbi:sensor histidine kinase [Anaerosporobacter sp.]|uniref:sensor histidine kinase n=1 Tax=Anaerosporobacter sp. TaxID=1872529 RepID=UPI00286F56BB|nr:histidine kinase [Anaerosporobacter sp.]
MAEHFRETYFLAIRTCLLLVLEVYIVLTKSVLTGASSWVLLLLALFVGAMAGKELVKTRMRKWFLLGIAILLCGIMIVTLGKEFMLLGIFLVYEIFSIVKPSLIWYCMPFVLACVPSEIGIYVQLVFTMLIGIIYIQHDFVVASYLKQTQEDTMVEQRLKQNIHQQEHEYREEMKRSLLMAENQLLEERARLSQTLHDKLGHNINGSIYQLEAVKLIMEKEPETAKKMTQAVIEQLRMGMDEIRAILRKERPKKYRLALLQLQQLCDECNQKGVEAELVVEGELGEVSEKYIEIILDNAFEAVSNSLKYAKCSKIEITIYVLNQLIRCSISDNGVGCDMIEEGMGITGMRKRVREVNGILNFETEVGFTINILLPR